ncbi:interferon-induced very large GTPase 1 isoform X2 [Labeo rohita]|uniref:interferon-induced very large GTPase 1 isoform X2 n=1 Tax=Labeo rohita TaxID=84645 RepID=UPI0021E22362|nr:interferon-induced very large GTPase 1 isoform X2 [Labeo rohita]
MMDPNPDDILPGEDKENSTVDFNQTQLNLNNLEVSPESKQNEFAEGPVLDDKETCGEVKKEVSEETFDMEQTSVPVTSEEQTPKTEITTDHSIQANMSGRENQAHKSLEEKNNSKATGHADMSKSPEPSDSSLSRMDPSLSVVLFGSFLAVQFGHENIVLGENIENLATSRIVSSQRKISDRHVSVINMIDFHETELYLESVDHLIGQLLDDNEIHAFIFVLRLNQLTDADKMGLEWLQRVFGDKVLQFVLILFTYETDEECDTIIDDLKKNSDLEQLLEKCGGRYQTCNKMMNNQSEMRELMNKIELLFNDNQQQCYNGEKRETEEPQKIECESAEAQIIRRNTESSTSAETEEQHMGNEQTLEEGSNSTPDGQADLRETPEVCDSDSSVICMDNMFPSMTIVLYGNSSSVQFGHENILLGEKQTNMKNSEISRIIPVQRKISERHISVIDMTDLHETEHVDHLIGQLLNEAEIHTFIFLVRMGQLTNDDKMGFEWLQRVFGDNVLQFVLILFTYEREEECDSITNGLIKNPVLEQLLEKCGGRFHICNKMMNSQSEMIELTDKIERLFNKNQQQCYTEKRRETEESQKTCERESEHGPTKNKQTGETTTSETHRGTKEELRRDKEEPDKHEEKERLTGSNSLFDKLHLEARPNLRAADVLQITKYSLQSCESCAEEELIQTFTQKLLMMNYRARYIKTKATNEQDDTQQEDKFSPGDEFDIFDEMSMSNKETSQSQRIHPMDVQMAVFHCADGFLKQLIVTKLSQCQYSLPLLVPDPFTQQLEFPLWTFRQINKSWKIRNTNNEIISQIQPIYKAGTPMVFFFRFGSVSSSKSQLMNSLINEKHNTFFHRNCTGSSRTRVLMDGVVEIAWFCPSGSYGDKFNDCVAFCNLHGDAGDHEKQLQILTEMSSVSVVVLPRLDRNDRHAAKIQNLSKNRKPLICLFTEDESTLIETRKGKYKIGLKDRNQSDVSEELRKAINACLSESSSIFRLEDVSKHSDIRVDEEDDDDCRRGRAAAQQMMSSLEKKDLTEIKESFLPHQGKLWHQWSQKNKELHRPRGHDTEMEISKKQAEMKNIREQQYELDVSGFMKIFIEQINSHAANKMLFLKWIRILLDEYTSADLDAVHHKYDEKWSKVLDLKKDHNKSNQLKAEQSELEKISEELQAAAFGLEHIMREIGQIYESCSSVKRKKDLQIDFSSLPSLAAEMMICGFPLELMDGDAAHVPVIWISAVLDQLIQKLGDQRVFVLSVLGIQSSGKSTMLNAMFGLQFTVSAGRCTRGAFMQLVKVSDEMKSQMNFDYILVVDTEGLRSLDLAGTSTRHHDNELATFVVGLGNLTLINIFGENLAEMQDVLQIVVQAFMRMKKVRLSPRCVFVHQNVSEVTAGEKNMEGRRRLQEKLDEMTKLAAKDEDSTAERFTDVIKFDVRNDVKYFAQLWEGSPPMAPPNPNYCENIQELKNTVLSKASESSCVTLSQFKGRINDLWNALLNENFVFSFRNIHEIAVYRRLETKYNDWTWKLRSAMLKIEDKFHTRIANGKYKVEQKDLLANMNQTKEAVQKSFVSYFEEDRDREVLSQWRGRFETKIEELHDDLIKRAKRTLDEVIQQKKTREKLDGKKTEYENKLFSRSKELAMQFRNTKTDEHELKKEFDSVWSTWVTELIKDTPPVKDIDIWKDVIKILSENHELSLLQERQHGTHYKQLDCLPDYSDYIIQKKSVHLTDQDQSPNCADASSETQEETSAIQQSQASSFLSFLKSLNPFRNRTVMENQHKPQSQNNTQDQDSVRVLIRNITEQTSKTLERAQTAQRGYHDSYIQEMTACVQKHISEYQSENKKFRLKKEFSVDLCLHVCELAHDKFTVLHNKFKNANDPKMYLERQKPQYYSVFKNYCRGATTTTIFGEFICSKLESSILQAVYNKTAIDLADLMKCDVPAFNGNRSKLEKHILTSLAEEENFQQYIKYIHNPREHFKHFITSEVSKFINQNDQKVLTKFRTNLTDTEKSVKAAVEESIAEVKRIKGDAIMWQKSFIETLSDELKLTGNSCADLSTITDFDFLEEVLQKDLKKRISELQNGFKSINGIHLEKCRKKPDGILIDQFCQCCWIQCPFCKAICTGTVENHPGDHSVTFHRVTGISGWKFRDTTFLTVNICTSAVASDRSFYPDSSDNTVLWREYRKGGDGYSDWSITTDVSELPYWKWFVCRFQKDLEDYYKNTFEEGGEIPKKWREHSKDEAIQSLDDYI